MNWYPRYYGDYMRDTAHLSLVEHGAYTVLLDHYYATGEGLPDDEKSLYRICRAFTDEERQAVTTVVGSFFYVGTDGRRHNKRADQELGKQGAISQKRAMAGVKGADGKWNGKQDGKCHGKPMANATTSTTTSTDTDTNTKCTPPPPKGGAARPPVPTFKNWTVEEFRQEIQASNGDGFFTDAEVEDFIGYWTEPSAAGKPRRAMEKTWHTRRRMQTAMERIYQPRRERQQHGLFAQPGQPRLLPGRAAPVSQLEDMGWPNPEDYQ
jgi:uncharacterized protein YdaU (DUF1376 family)